MQRARLGRCAIYEPVQLFESWAAHPLGNEVKSREFQITC
jgi:hypothetical protein